METTSTPPTTFIFLATDAQGNRRYVDASADNISAARYRLEVQGYTAIEVVKESLDARIEANLRSDVWEGMTLQEKTELQQKCQGPDADRFVFWQYLKGDGLVLVCLGVWVWFSATGQRPWGLSSVLSYACMVGFLVLTARILIPGRLYTRLLEARAWKCWDQVTKVVGRLRAIRWFTGPLIPDFELLFSEARALAGRGDLRAGLEKVRPFESDPAFAPALYYALLASVYENANDFAGQIACQEKALALDPHSASSRIDLAFALVLNQRNVQRAEAVLQELNEEDVVPMARVYLDLTRGVMALDAGRHAEAEALFDQAAVAWTAFESDPLSKSFRWIIQGCHAAALRRLGRIDEAEAMFAEVQPFLEATRELSVLDRWNGR